MSERIHVVPVGDLKPHIESGEWCHCRPRVTKDGIVVHGSLWAVFRGMLVVLAVQLAVDKEPK